MKKIIVLAVATTIGVFAADTSSQYSYEYQKKAYEQAKGDGEMQQHRYRKGQDKQEGDGEMKQHQYGQNGTGNAQQKGGGRR